MVMRWRWYLVAVYAIAALVLLQFGSDVFGRAAIYAVLLTAASGIAEEQLQ